MNQELRQKITNPKLQITNNIKIQMLKTVLNFGNCGFEFIWDL